MGGKLKGPKDIEDKTCTDCCCLCLFITFWIGIAAIATVTMSVRAPPTLVAHVGGDSP